MSATPPAPTANSSEEQVVWPLATSAAPDITGLRQVDTLGGKRIAFLWDHLFRGEEMFEAFIAAARDRGVEFDPVRHEIFGDIHGPDERAVIEAIPALLADRRVDAVIVGVGACGSCTPAVVRACQAVEAAGLPALALVSSGFMRQARATAKAVGLDHVWIAEYPGVIPVDDDDTFHLKLKDHVVPSLFEGFAQLAQGVEPVTGSAATDPRPRATVFTGTYDEIQDHFDLQGWSDGLPITAPTVARVESFLAYTDRDPDEVIGVMLPAMRNVTVWSVAVNGVMAGCRPEYFPVLLAVAEVIADPDWRLEDAGCTPGWEPLVLVSGPIAEAIGMNNGAGMMRVGNRANTSIGRFTRLIMRNLAGFLTPPGDTDKAAIGRTFNVAMAENDTLTTAIGWQPSRVDAGFSEQDSVVSVQSCVGISGPAYTGGAAEEQLEVLTRYTIDTLGPWAFTNIFYGASSTLVLMSPSVARSLAEAGYDKAAIRRHLAEHTRIEAGVLEAEARMARGEKFSFTDLAARGLVPPAYAESNDPSRRVQVIPDPASIRIVLGGDPGRNQNRIYWNNHEQGLAMHRRVEVNAVTRARLAMPHAAAS